MWTVADNSGIKTVRQLRVKKFKRQRADPGDILTVFPKKYTLTYRKRWSAAVLKVGKRREKSKALKCRALVLTIKRKFRRYTGISIQALKNRVVLIEGRKSAKFMGSNIRGPAMREVSFRRQSYAYRKVHARIGYYI